MTEKNNINANERIDESGRSMIEMLGTLAIIGVLSIGGVSGYGRAINAYRANTIVDAAQKKALMTSHELTTGSTVTPDINGAMKTPSGYQVTESTSTGTTGDITPDTKYFGVEVGDTTNGGKAVPVEVAKNLLDKALDSWKYVYGFGVKSADGTGNVSWVTKSGSGTGGIDDAIGNNQTVIIILVYAADLSLRPGELLDGAQFTDGGQTGNTCTPTCATGATCQNGVCVCTNGNVYLSYNEGTECDTETPNMECTNNSDCTSDEYCHYSSVNSSTCKPDKKGTCVKKADAKGEFATGTTAEAAGFIRSASPMDWFSAQNFCRSYNKNLVTLSQMGLGSAVPSGKIYCSDYSGNDGCQITADEWSAIRTKFGTDFYPWTENLVSSPSTSCHAFYVSLVVNSANVNFDRCDFSRDALCE